jgi:peptidyl-prolyl cis-trans isomerase C
MQIIALHHILLKSPLLAEDVAKELELGADFAELAREYSACPSSHDGGFAGYHDQDELPLEIISALANHNDQKTYAGPVATDLGFHLLKPVGEKPRLALSDQYINDQEANISEVFSAEDDSYEVSESETESLIPSDS